MGCCRNSLREPLLPTPGRSEDPRQGGPADLRPLTLSTLSYEEARTNFVQSCCGYTLIHYVLGIADRHPSNIMLTEDGKVNTPRISTVTV